MKQSFAVLLLLLMTTPCLMAQKTKVANIRQELSQARSSIKSGKYAEAEKALATLLKDSVNRTDKRVWMAYYDAVLGQYEQGNEKLYLKQQYDTAAFFAKALQLLTVAESYDSLTDDSRKKHSQLLNTIRPNIFNGGSFLLRKEKWADAYRYYEAYIDCSRQPLFEAYHYDSLDTRLPEAAYWATYCGYKMQNAVLTLRYHKLAMKDESKADFTLQFVAEARKWLNDDELYVKTMEEGFRRFPEFHYFFPRLMDAYTGMGQYEKALALTDTALMHKPSSELYLFAKSTTLLRMERYAESIKYSERLIEVNPNLAEPYFNAGTAYVNIADRLANRKEKKLVKRAYQKACPYMEHYRKLTPNQKDKWGPVLYRIYLNLNMGKQFDEIDKLLKK